MSDQFAGTEETRLAAQTDEGDCSARMQQAGVC